MQVDIAWVIDAEPRAGTPRELQGHRIAMKAIRTSSVRALWVVPASLALHTGDMAGGSACDSRSAAETVRLSGEVQKMVKRTAVVLLALGIVVGQLNAHERDLLARFDGGIGVIPVSNGAGPANADGTLPNVRLNVVRGISPGAGPWRIADLRATVDFYGRIKVNGRGLLLASGNSIGQNANQRVFATLICEAAAPFVARSTDVAGVPLEPNGDFRIDDTLDPAPTECLSPVLLIRNTGGVWFAAGIPALGDDE